MDMKSQADDKDLVKALNKKIERLQKDLDQAENFLKKLRTQCHHNYQLEGNSADKAYYLCTNCQDIIVV